MRIEELQERLAELNDTSQAIIAKAEAEHRDLTTDEQTDLDRCLADFDKVKGDIERLHRLHQQTDALKAGAGRKTEALAPQDEPDAGADADPEPPPTRQSLRSRIAEEKVPARYIVERKGGFHSLGDMCKFVRQACMPGGIMDRRLERLANPTTFGNEGTGADGGFAVPPDFREMIMSKVMGETELISRTDKLTSSSNTITLPKDETTPWQTTGGIQAYWEGEGGLKTQSKPSLETSTLRLNKVISLVPVTDELLEDAPAMDTYIRRKAPEKISFKVNLAIVQGNGVGQPLGILNSPSLVTVSKEGSQAADTILFANIVKMWSRLYAPSRANAVWLVSQDIEPQLAALEFKAGAASPVPAYLPAGGLSAAPYATLYGRPVIPTQACETLGDKGDIILVDLSQYITAVKSSGPRAETSIHLWFDYDITAYRFVLRVGGQPWWNTAITQRDGNNTLSWAVTLEERA